METDTKDDNIARVTRCPGLGLTSGWAWNAWNAENVRIPMDASRLRKTKILVPLTILLLAIGCHYFNALPLTVFKLFPHFYTHTKKKKRRRNMSRKSDENVLIWGDACAGTLLRNPRFSDAAFKWCRYWWNLVYDAMKYFHNLFFFSPSPSRKENEFLMICRWRTLLMNK